jgi:hypothetical protein
MAAGELGTLPAVFRLEVLMYIGKLLFAQVMDHAPWKTFHRIVHRYRGDHRVKRFTCADQFRCMAFAQLTFRESLRDIEACLSAHASKLYHMGLRAAITRSTLADANESRGWRIYAEFAQALIRTARPLYVHEDLGVELTNTVYALDATTIDLCLSLFPWAPFRSTKAAIKLHTLLDLRGAIPSFIHISDGKLHDVNVLDLLLPEPAAFYLMDRGYLDFQRLWLLTRPAVSLSSGPNAICGPAGSILIRWSAAVASSATRPSSSQGSISANAIPLTCGGFATKTPTLARRWCS